MHIPAAKKSGFMGNEIPFQVGISGGIGSGKSIFASLFARMGIPVYESDQWAKAQYFNSHIREQVISLLGNEAYKPDGSPDRDFIAGKIYGNPQLRNELNGIIHPAVAKHYRQWLEQQSSPYILKVAALLFEADIARDLDFNVLIISPESLRKNRVSLRDPQRNAAQIEAIMASQWTDERKQELADAVVYNDEQHSLIGQAVQLDKQVLDLIRQGK
jgi:dephospho-CoA kinase